MIKLVTIPVLIWIILVAILSVIVYYLWGGQYYFPIFWGFITGWTIFNAIYPKIPTA